MPERTETQEPQAPDIQDAILLWNDTKRILARTAGNDRLRAMMDACEPTSLDGNLLTVATRSGFAQHNLDASKPQILRALSEAAFQPMDLSIEYEDPHWEDNPQFPEVITRRFTRAEVTPFPTELTAADAAGLSGTEPNLASQSVPTPTSSSARGEAPSQPFPASAQTSADAIAALKAHPLAIQGLAQTVDGPAPADVIPIGVARTTISEDEFRRQFAGEAPSTAVDRASHQRPQPILEDTVGEGGSMFTFDTFVEGEENHFALMAAKQVANGGDTNQFNPLFIYGNSGLGKTHLLLSIKNYIAANDPSRFCIYRTAREFINDYSSAMARDKTIKDNLVDSYRGVDVLILDDIQHMLRAAGTIEFFFDTFNYLVSNSKQIVLAADVPPTELMARGMPERITSRMASGFPISIQRPELELKRNLIRTFYKRDKADDLPGYEGTITDDVLNAMAQYCGNNIRLIKAYVQQALFLASQIQRVDPKAAFTEADAEALAKERGLLGHHNITMEEIQSMVEKEFGVSHAELVSSKRNKDIAQARHVAIWLSRLLTDNTLKKIGQYFGGRSHTTCLHSCEWVDTKLHQVSDRYFIDTVNTLRRKLEAL